MGKGTEGEFRWRFGSGTIVLLRDSSQNVVRVSGVETKHHHDWLGPRARRGLVRIGGRLRLHWAQKLVEEYCWMLIEDGEALACLDGAIYGVTRDHGRFLGLEE